jgi:tetratricopeptide (TPR) repeat protein
LQAIDFHEQAPSLRREIGDRQGEAISLGNLGTAYQSLGPCQRAIEFHQQSLEIAREIGDRLGVATSYFNLGNTMAKLDQKPEDIISAYENARQLFQNMKLYRSVERCDAALRKFDSKEDGD